MLTLGLITYCLSVYATDNEILKIEERIKPVGQVHIEANDTASPVVVSLPITSTVRSSQAIYEQFCTVCHQSGLAGAPKFRDAKDWAPRLSTKKIDGLLASALKGLNAMPPKGTCQDCSDAEIKSAIEYMLPQ